MTPIPSSDRIKVIRVLAELGLFLSSKKVANGNGVTAPNTSFLTVGTLPSKSFCLSTSSNIWAAGDVIIMSMAVEGNNYSKELIQRAFNKLVSKDEYDQSEKREIIECLVNYSQKSVL